MQSSEIQSEFGTPASYILGKLLYRLDDLFLHKLSMSNAAWLRVPWAQVYYYITNPTISHSVDMCVRWPAKHIEEFKIQDGDFKEPYEVYMALSKLQSILKLIETHNLPRYREAGSPKNAFDLLYPSITILKTKFEKYLDSKMVKPPLTQRFMSAITSSTVVRWTINLDELNE